MAIIQSPIPDTWQTGQLVTADWLNRNIRDVQKFLAYAPLTIVQRTAAQSIATGTNTAVTWDTEIIDIDGMFSNPSSRIIAQRPGVYAIQFEPHFASSTLGTVRAGHISINGPNNWIAHSNNMQSNSYETCLNTAVIVALNTGDYVEGYVWQNTGAALNTGGGTYNAPRMSVRCISSAAVDVDYVAGTTSNPKPPPSKPPTPPAPTNYTKTYYATWSRSYDGDNTTTWDDSPYCYQGYYDGNRGNTKSLVGFNFGQIERDLKGATNIRIKFTFKVHHTYWGSGSTIVVGAHSYASKPGSVTVGGNGANKINAPQQKAIGGCKAETSHTVDFGAGNWEGWAFQNGTITGMAFGPGPSSDRGYYAYMYGATQGGKPYLTISYTK